MEKKGLSVTMVTKSGAALVVVEPVFSTTLNVCPYVHGLWSKRNPIVF